MASRYPAPHRTFPVDRACLGTTITLTNPYNMDLQRTQRFGFALIVLGALGLLVAAILALTLGCQPAPGQGPGMLRSPGALPAVSLFLVLLGMTLYFPELLSDENKGLSTMRVVIFMIISVFIIIAMKIGWEATGFSDWDITPTWVTLIGLAFGGKMIQSLSEQLRQRAITSNAISLRAGTRPAASTPALRNISTSRSGERAIRALGQLTLTLKTVSGTITLFYAFVDGKRVIAGEGNEEQRWSGPLPQGEVQITILVSGVGSAAFELGIDLPGTVEDQTMQLNLDRGYYETTFAL